MATELIVAIENGKFAEAQRLMEKDLYIKADAFLDEKKKQIVARTWNTKSLNEDSKSVFNASRRKAFREKMQKLHSVKGGK